MATSFVGFTVIALALGELRGSTRFDGVGCAARHGPVRRRARIPHRDLGAGAHDAARAALVFTLEAPFAALFGVLLADEILGWEGGWAAG